MFEDIQNLFLNQHGGYAKILQFETLVIIIAIIIFFTIFFPNTYAFIIILLMFAIYFANSFVTIQNSSVNDFNHITMVKLQQLQQKSNEHIRMKLDVIQNSNPSVLSQSEIQKMYDSNNLNSMYIDANMIHFLDSILPLFEYNNYIYYSLLKGTNNILRIKEEIDTYYEANGEYPININEMFETALELRMKTINNMHDFIYTIPKSNTMYKYLNDVTNRYSVLISRVTDSIYVDTKKNIELRGINANTKFVSYNKTKPFDPKYNHPIIPNTNNNENMVQFYI